MVKKTVAETRQLGGNVFRSLFFCASAVCDLDELTYQTDISMSGNLHSFPFKVQALKLSVPSGRAWERGRGRNWAASWISVLLCTPSLPAEVRRLPPSPGQLAATPRAPACLPSSPSSTAPSGLPRSKPSWGNVPNQPAGSSSGTPGPGPAFSASSRHSGSAVCPSSSQCAPMTFPGLCLGAGIDRNFVPVRLAL